MGHGERSVAACVLRAAAAVAQRAPAAFAHGHYRAHRSGPRSSELPYEWPMADGGARGRCRALRGPA
eukprot:6886283-Prymnesium_polylepis.1